MRGPVASANRCYRSGAGAKFRQDAAYGTFAAVFHEVHMLTQGVDMSWSRKLGSLYGLTTSSVSVASRRSSHGTVLLGSFEPEHFEDDGASLFAQGNGTQVHKSGKASTAAIQFSIGVSAADLPSMVMSCCRQLVR